MTIRLTHPLPIGTRTDGFGWRGAVTGVIGAGFHTGQDFAAPEGTPIYAAQSGRVNRVWYDRFPDGSDAGGLMLQIGGAVFSTRYAHLSKYAVSYGDEVQAGQIIGYVGATGAARGDHLHFELIVNSSYTDPLPYLTSTPFKEETATMKPFLITTDNGDILVVDHAQKSYWNVAEGIPTAMVQQRLDWLTAQKAIQPLVGRQPAALLASYRHVADAKLDQKTITSISQEAATRVTEAVTELKELIGNVNRT